MKASPQPLRCLLVEDMEDDAKLVLRALHASGYDVTAERVETPEAMRAALERAPWDLVLSDFSMPRFSGLDALKIVQASGHDLPFILVSGAMGEETAVNAMRAGAHDYLLKHDLSRLGPAVERELTNAADRRARRFAEEAARRSEALLVVAGQLASFGGWSVNLAENTVAWTDQVALIHEEPPGFSPTLAQGINYYPPEWRDKITAVFTACARDGTPYDEEMEILTARGRRVWVRTTGRAVRDEAGRIDRVHGAFQDISVRKQAEAVDLFLAQAGVSQEGEPFFPSLARFLAKNLQMDYICIDRLEGDALNATTLAVWHDGHFEDNLTYALKDTPCGEVVGKTVCCYPAHVIQTFPHDAALQELRAESYIGVTLFSHTGHPIGLIAVIGRQPLANRAIAETTLARVALRAAGELERLTVEAELKASEERHRTLFNTMMEGFALYQVLFDGQSRPCDIRILDVNPAFEVQTGLHNVRGRLVREVMPLVEDHWYEFFGQVARTGAPAHVEKEAKALQRWFAVSAYRVGEPAHRKVGVIFHDITTRKLAELGLVESERTQRKLAEAFAQAQLVGNIGSWDTDLATQQVRWSEQTHRIFETTAATFRPNHQAFLAFVHPDDRAAVDTAFNASTRVCTTSTIEHRIVMRDGRIKYVEERWETLGDDISSPVRAVGTCLVITERKQAEVALRFQTEELRLRNDALTRFNEAAVGRELRMLELKREINEFCDRVGEPPRHRIAEAPAKPANKPPP